MYKNNSMLLVLLRCIYIFVVVNNFVALITASQLVYKELLTIFEYVMGHKYFIKSCTFASKDNSGF